MSRRAIGTTERRGAGRRRSFVAVLVATAMLGLAGCSTIGVGDPMVSQASAPATSVLSAAQNPAADPEHDRIVASYGGVYDDPAAAQAVARAVGRVVAASDDPSQSYRITILNSPAVNAFALPSGNLYVTRGLIALADDTSEVAAVIAHEMAHVTARHAVARARRAEVAAEVTKMANVMQDQGAQRLALASTQLSLARFSQVQELEADAIGVRTLARAGFDPFAASRFLSAMARFADYRTAARVGSKNPDFLSSHPSTPERISFAVRAAREIGAPGIGEQEREQYLRGLDGMVFGDDPSEGFVRGRSFLHKGLGIQFTVPPGYTLENTTKAVLATDASGMAMRFDGVSLPPDTPLTTYLASGWINGLLADSIRTTTIGDLAAATATAKADGWTFQIGVVRKARTVFRFIFAAQDDGPVLQTALADTMATFRRLTPEESTRLRPLRLHIVRVKPGDTVASLAEQMAGTERRVELFRILNGLGPDDVPEPGRLVKILGDG